MLIKPALLAAAVLASAPAPESQQPAPPQWQREIRKTPDSLTLTPDQVFNLYQYTQLLEAKVLQAEDERDKWRQRALACRGREIS